MALPNLYLYDNDGNPNPGGGPPIPPVGTGGSIPPPKPPLGGLPPDSTESITPPGPVPPAGGGLLAGLDLGGNIGLYAIAAFAAYFLFFKKD